MVYLLEAEFYIPDRLGLARAGACVHTCIAVAADLPVLEIGEIGAQHPSGNSTRATETLRGVGRISSLYYQ
jgi:hypothetical protein